MVAHPQFEYRPYPLALRTAEAVSRRFPLSLFS